MPIVVVIVEDEEPLVRLYTRVLKLRGYEVIEFYLGKPALAYLTGANNRMDLLIVDIKLPDMDGIDLASQVRAHGYLGPIIVSSGWQKENSDRTEKLALGGFVSKLCKPSTINEFVMAVQQATNNIPSAGSEHASVTDYMKRIG